MLEWPQTFWNIAICSGDMRFTVASDNDTV